MIAFVNFESRVMPELPLSRYMFCNLVALLARGPLNHGWKGEEESEGLHACYGR